MVICIIWIYFNRRVSFCNYFVLFGLICCQSHFKWCVCLEILNLTSSIHCLKTFISTNFLIQLRFLNHHSRWKILVFHITSLYQVINFFKLRKNFMKFLFSFLISQVCRRMNWFPSQSINCGWFLICPCAKPTTLSTRNLFQSSHRWIRLTIIICHQLKVIMTKIYFSGTFLNQSLGLFL